MSIVMQAVATLIAVSCSATEQNASKGKTEFRECAAYHQVGGDAENWAGPVPTNAIDGPAGSEFRLKDVADRPNVTAYPASFKTAAAAPEASFCIVNATDATHLFAIETREGARQLSELAPGARLCSARTRANDGVVSVFENADGFEGCSRIVAVGDIEELLDYAEFDRCGWGSHNF